MKMHSLRKDNTLKVLYSVKNGNDTILKISNDINLSRMSVGKIVQELIKQEILNVEKPSCDRSGRRTAHLSLSESFYVAYAEEHVGGLRVILIDAKENVVDRFDIVHKVGDIGYTRTFAKFLTRPDYNKCLGVFIEFSNPNPPTIIPKKFIKSDKITMITGALSEKDKIIFFKLKNELIISVYGNIIHSDCSLEDAKKVLKPDKIYEIEEEPYYMLFNCMAKYAIEMISKLIK